VKVDLTNLPPDFKEDFCSIQTLSFTATLRNSSSGPLFVSVYDRLNIRVAYLRYNGTDLIPINVPRYYPKGGPARGAIQALTVLGPGESATFKIPHICPIDPATGLAGHYVYPGVGDYKVRFTYHYTGPAFGSGGGSKISRSPENGSLPEARNRVARKDGGLLPDTFQGTSLSNEVTLHVTN
jgi:hypothetical protein